MDYRQTVFQTSLSQALKNSVMQHYFTAQETENPTPMPPFMAEVISEVCKNLSKVAVVNSTDTDNWKNIKEYAEFMMEALPRHVEELDKQKTSSPSDNVSQGYDNVVAPVNPSTE